MSRKRKEIKGKPLQSPASRVEITAPPSSRPIKLILLLLILTGSALAFFWSKSFSPALPRGFPALPDMTQASPVLREVVQRANANARAHPDSGEAIGSLAMTYHANQFFESARLAYELARELEPKDYRWSYFQALLEEDTAHTEVLVGLLERTIQLEAYLPAMQKLADLSFKQDQLQRASSLYTQILETDPSFLQASLGWARTAARKEDWVHVVQRLEPLAQQQPRLRPHAPPHTQAKESD